MKNIASVLKNNEHIVCNKKLIKLFGIEPALLLGELCAEYIYYRNKNQLTEDDEFYSTQENIEENTGINAYSQRKALKILQDNNIIQITKKGLPSKNYYKINLEQLSNIINSTK